MGDLRRLGSGIWTQINRHYVGIHSASGAYGVLVSSEHCSENNKNITRIKEYTMNTRILPHPPFCGCLGSGQVVTARPCCTGMYGAALLSAHNVDWKKRERTTKVGVTVTFWLNSFYGFESDGDAAGNGQKNLQSRKQIDTRDPEEKIGSIHLRRNGCALCVFSTHKYQLCLEQYKA